MKLFFKHNHREDTKEIAFAVSFFVSERGGNEGAKDESVCDSD